MPAHEEVQRARHALEHSLHNSGYSNVSYMRRKLETEGHDVLRATLRGQAVAVRAYWRRGANLEKTAAEMLRLSSLAHPHIIKPLSLFTTDSLLGVVTEYASAGSLFHAVTAGGLAYADALPLFQQLTLAMQFCHAYGIHLRRVSPANLLLCRSTQGALVLKIFDFRLAKDTSWEGNTVTRLQPALYTCPHALRPTHEAGRQCEDYAAVCDVWALAVTLYFLCFGRWPFSREQISAWEQPAAADPSAWNDDATLFAGVNTARVPPEVCAFLAAVFAGGRRSAAQYAADPACPSLADIIAAPWFQRGLPAGAADIWRTHCEETKRLRESPLFRQLDAALMRVLDPFGHGDLPQAVLAGLPPRQQSTGGSPQGSSGDSSGGSAGDPASGGSAMSAGGVSGTSSGADLD